MAADFRRVAVIGRGLIGSSIELAVSRCLPDVEVVTLDRGDDLEGIRGADLVILATPILEIIRLLPILEAQLPSDALVTDTGSTKAAIVAAAEAIRFVGGHPVAGAAASGADSARADLFAGHPWILTPSASAAPGDVARLQRLIESLGATVRLMDAEAHDRLFAFVSHLPQLVVSAMMEAVGTHAGNEGLALAGAGLRDSTRLAASPPGIWRDVAHTNHQHIARAIDAVVEILLRLRDDNTGGELQATFTSAARWKRALEDRSI